METFLANMPSIKVDAQHRYVLFHGGAVEHADTDAQGIVIYAGNELMGLGRLLDNQLKISTRLVDE